jgi:ribokinase
MRKIAVVGSFVMDLIAQVDEFPQEGQTVIGKGFVTLPGGKGANQAVSASRQGADVAMYGRVGDDDFGKTFLGLFESEGIDTGRVKMLKEFPTAMGLIQLNRSGENKIVVVPGANFGYELDDLIRDSEDFLKADLVLAQLELKPEVTFKLIELCFDAKVPIILNPAPATAIPDDILSKITILTPNETELEIFRACRLTP